jgi:hypothetical protein
MLEVVAREALEYHFGFGCAQPQGGRILNHLIVPRLGEHNREVFC